MFAFRADSASQVRAFHAAGLSNGGTDEGPPGVREYYEPEFFVAYLRDPDGNKLAAVFHRYDPAFDRGAKHRPSCDFVTQNGPFQWAFTLVGQRLDQFVEPHHNRMGAVVVAMEGKEKATDRTTIQTVGGLGLRAAD